MKSTTGQAGLMTSESSGRAMSLVPMSKRGDKLTLTHSLTSPSSTPSLPSPYCRYSLWFFSLFFPTFVSKNSCSSFHRFTLSKLFLQTLSLRFLSPFFLSRFLLPPFPRTATYTILSTLLPILIAPILPTPIFVSKCNGASHLSPHSLFLPFFLPFPLFILSRLPFSLFISFPFFFSLLISFPFFFFSLIILPFLRTRLRAHSPLLLRTYRLVYHQSRFSPLLTPRIWFLLPM